MYNSDVNINKNICLIVKKKGETLRIPVHDIMYIESVAHKLHLYTKESMYAYNDKMVNVEQLLKKQGFIRCHQSYLVNFDMVSSVKKDRLIVGEQEIRISRKYKDDVKRHLSGDTDYGIEEKANVVYTGKSNEGSLLCVRGPYTGKLFELVPEQRIILGRDGDACDIVINLPRVSRQHLYITYHKDKHCYEVMDMSTNGTYINGEIRLEHDIRYEISKGEKLGIGDGVAEFKLL